MKTGKSIQEIAAELARQVEAKRDIVADTRDMLIVPAENGVALRVSKGGVGGEALLDGEIFGLKPNATRQIGERVGIPKKYADRMASEAPELLATNVNHWFRANPERRMVRTLDGSARAFLSDRYRRVDNADIFEAVYPVLEAVPDMNFVSCEVTESRMYLKALFPRLEGEVLRGDVVQSGVVISNSEIGLGAIRVEPLVFRLICLNGMICPDSSLRKHHVGGRVGGGDDAVELFRDETIEADDKAFLMKVNDVVRSTVDEAKFNDRLIRFREAAGEAITGDVPKAVEELSQRCGLTDGEGSSILRNLIAGGDLSKWGIANAVTRAAGDVESYDRATELERIGGNIIELPKADWTAIVEAA